MPILAFLLSMLTTPAGAAGGRFLGSQAIKRLLPSLFAQAGKKVGVGALKTGLGSVGPFSTTLGGIGSKAAATAGGAAGLIAPFALLGGEDDQGVSGPPAASEVGTEDIFRSLQSGQGFNSEQGRNVQRLFEETEIINVLASLGIDPNDFLSAAQPIV